MKIHNLKKKSIILSLVLIISGIIISIAGFGAVGFNYNRLLESSADKVWYRTIHMNEEHFWYGINVDEDTNVFVIGNSD